jgi:hypothetical protein
MTSFPLKANRSKDFVGLKLGLFIDRIELKGEMYGN